MGVYATTTAISELLPNYLVGNTTTSDTAGTNIFSRHIDRAEGVVMAFSGARYDVAGLRVATTTTNVPVLLRTLSEDIATWFAARGSYVQDGGQKQQYLDAYDKALTMLMDIRDGKTKLVDTTGAEIAPRSAARYLTSTDYTHIINLDDPNSWKVDVDQVNSISSGRS